MLEHRAALVPSQIEVRVLCHVDGRRLVGRGMHLDEQLILRGKSIGDARLDCARVVLLARPRAVCQLHMARAPLHQPPRHLVPPARSSMQRARECAFVARQHVRLAAEREAGVGNAVGNSPHHCAEVRRGAVGVPAEVGVVEAEADVGEPAVPARHVRVRFLTLALTLTLP